MQAALAVNQISNAMVVVLGVGIVFVGLVCIVAVCAVMSAIIRATQKKAPAAAPVAAAPAAPVEIPNRGAFIAAVSCAIAEELGEDVSAIRILSVKRV